MSNPKSESDKISSMMGQYLLQGYTLLDEYCQTCMTPLMKKKTEPNFCIYCDKINKQASSNADKTDKNDRMPQIQDNSSGAEIKESNMNSSSKLNENFKKIINTMSDELELLLKRQKNITERTDARQNYEDIISVLKVIDKTIETSGLAKNFDW